MFEQEQQRFEQPIPRPLGLDIKPDFLRVVYLIDQQRVRSVVEVIHPGHTHLPAERLDAKPCGTATISSCQRFPLRSPKGHGNSRLISISRFDRR